MYSLYLGIDSKSERTQSSIAIDLQHNSINPVLQKLPTLLLLCLAAATDTVAATYVEAVGSIGLRPCRDLCLHPFHPGCRISGQATIY
ncbi:hypothetical protein V2G26_006315 [Clonostachys chloroleuca]